MRCPFCGSTSLRRTHVGVAHPRRREHGPFDLYACIACRSVVTSPLPSRAALGALYGSFASGVEGSLRDLRAETPLTAWFSQVVDRTASLGRFRGAFRWLDVGAGGGELAALLAHRYPEATGTAIDWAGRPAGVPDRVDWQLADLNEPFNAPQADLVISLSVWEHVLDPEAFVRSLIARVAPGGLLYLVCPDAGSLAARLLRSRWPYFLPGEHLHMPTRDGARRLLKRLANPGDQVDVGRVGLPYPPAYVLGYLGLGRIAPLARRLPSVPLPVGAIEAVVRRAV